jgi:hypothetical protein
MSQNKTVSPISKKRGSSSLSFNADLFAFENASAERKTSQTNQFAEKLRIMEDKLEQMNRNLLSREHENL